MVAGKKYGNPRRIIRSERFFKMGRPYVFGCCFIVYRNLILLPYDLYGKKRINNRAIARLFSVKNRREHYISNMKLLFCFFLCVFLFCFLEEKAIQIYPLYSSKELIRCA